MPTSTPRYIGSKNRWRVTDGHRHPVTVRKAI